MPNVIGRLSAAFAEIAGQTRLIDKYHAYPLKIAKPFLFGNGHLGIYLMDASPGIMAGDEYTFDWRFGERTSVYITNQSYTKVHPARADAAEASRSSKQSQVLHLARESFVEYMPEPLMLYKDAIFYNSTEILMEPGSALIYCDAVCPGRTQRGELFQYKLYQNRMTVMHGDEMIYSSKQRVTPAASSLSGIGGWSDFTHYGTLYVFSDRVDASFVESLRHYLDEHTQTADDGAGFEGTGAVASRLIYGVSESYKYGLVLSVLGVKIHDIQTLLETAWRFVRTQLFYKPPLVIRK